jgi:hypothetical protein
MCHVSFALSYAIANRNEMQREIFLSFLFSRRTARATRWLAHCDCLFGRSRGVRVVLVGAVDSGQTASIQPSAESRKFRSCSMGVARKKPQIEAPKEALDKRGRDRHRSSFP